MYLVAVPVFICYLQFCVCVFLLLSCMSFLYILDINPLSDISFANIFSHLVGCLFILLMVSFAVQKLLSLSPACLFLLQKNTAAIYVKKCPAYVFL